MKTYQDVRVFLRTVQSLTQVARASELQLQEGSFVSAFGSVSAVPRNGM